MSIDQLGIVGSPSSSHSERECQPLLPNLTSFLSSCSTQRNSHSCSVSREGYVR